MNPRCSLLYRDAELLARLADVIYGIKLKKLPSDVCRGESCCTSDSACFSNLFTYTAKLCLRMCATELELAAGQPCNASISLYSKRHRTYRLTVPPGFMLKVAALPASLDFTDETIFYLVTLTTELSLDHSMSEYTLFETQLVGELVNLILSIASPSSMYGGMYRVNNNDYLSSLLRSSLNHLDDCLAKLEQFILRVSPGSYASPDFYFPVAYDLDTIVSSMFSPRGMYNILYYTNFYLFTTMSSTSSLQISIPLTVYYFLFCHFVMLLSQALPIFPALVEQVLGIPVFAVPEEDVQDSSAHNVAADIPDLTALSSSPQSLFNQALCDILAGGG